MGTGASAVYLNQQRYKWLTSGETAGDGTSSVRLHHEWTNNAYCLLHIIIDTLERGKGAP
eukprot:scaffold6570_cov51-Attheya_sp.AAC.1